MSYDWGKTMGPCSTCEALARTVMLDQTSHDTKQEWKGLTDEEIHDCFQNRGSDKLKTRKLIAAAIEAKLKEKNGG
jgi:hypothetical protein